MPSKEVELPKWHGLSQEGWQLPDYASGRYGGDFLYHPSPAGNPFLNMIQHDTDPTFLETKLQEIGYYDPLPVQYGKWLLRTLQLDLGYSIQHRAPVAALIADRFGNTLLLAMSSFVLSTVISIGIGVFSAMYPNSLWDRALTVLSFIGVSIPVFFFGLLLIKVFGYDLAVLPFQGLKPWEKLPGIDRRWTSGVT